MIECVGAIVARALAGGHGWLIAGQLAEAGALAQLELLSEPERAEFAAEPMGVIPPDEAEWTRTAVNRSKGSFRKMLKGLEIQTGVSPEKRRRGPGPD
jgi:hypothetical protein